MKKASLLVVMLLLVAMLIFPAVHAALGDSGEETSEESEQESVVNQVAMIPSGPSTTIAVIEQQTGITITDIFAPTIAGGRGGGGSTSSQKSSLTIGILGSGPNITFALLEQKTATRSDTGRLIRTRIAYKGKLATADKGTLFVSGTNLAQLEATTQNPESSLNQQEMGIVAFDFPNNKITVTFNPDEPDEHEIEEATKRPVRETIATPQPTTAGDSASSAASAAHDAIAKRTTRAASTESAAQPEPKPANPTLRASDINFNEQEITVGADGQIAIQQKTEQSTLISLLKNLFS